METKKTMETRFDVYRNVMKMGVENDESKVKEMDKCVDVMVKAISDQKKVDIEKLGMLRKMVDTFENTYIERQTKMEFECTEQEECGNENVFKCKIGLPDTMFLSKLEKIRAKLDNVEKNIVNDKGNGVTIILTYGNDAESETMKIVIANMCWKELDLKAFDMMSHFTKHKQLMSQFQNKE
jgi:hypothetical protein